MLHWTAPEERMGYSMEKFCGQRFYIKQQARFLLNEETNEMRRIKNAYTLDGVTCAGQGLTRPQQCDRACLYVWNDAWLEKLLEKL